eukprot:evm.model.scf_21EXC.25 EVM.evm.TU.scf_21EXC.25   scf_21EXC:221917-227164(-)
MDWHLRVCALLALPWLLLVSGLDGRELGEPNLVTSESTQAAGSPAWQRQLQQFKCSNWSCPAQVKLFDSILHGNLTALREARAEGANVNLPLENNLTILNMAASRARTKIGEQLIEWGADQDAGDNNGTNALHRASSSGFADFVEMLLSKNATVDPRNDYNFTPLHYAAYGHGWEKLNATIFHPDAVGEEFQSTVPTGLRPDHAAVAKLLLTNGADPNARNWRNETPLHYVGTWNRYQICSLLLKQGAEIDAVDAEGETPLHEAVGYGGVDVVKVLLEGGADTYIEDLAGDTPREFICRCTTYTNNRSLHQCAPQRCQTPTEDQIMESLIDNARQNLG